MKRTPIISFLLFLFISPLQSQTLQSFPDSSRTLVYEKVYLHIDRDLYAPGNIIWFKTYLVNGLTHQLLPGYKNIFVQLVSEKGKVFYDRILLSREGTAEGDFTLGDSIPDGQYIIRAYTRYLENFGEKSFFHKKIMITRTYRLPGNEKPAPAGHKIDVAFLPESGNLVLNAVNYVAFKAIDETGKGIDVSGRIVDENDSTITPFHTVYQGMGELVLMPLEGKTYSAEIDRYPGFSFRFSDSQENGLALHCQEDGCNVIFIVSRNFRLTGNRKIYLVASHKGVMLFYREVEINGMQEALKISGDIFPPGISKITLLGQEFEELAERLIFIPDKPECFSMEIDRKELSTRDSVDVDLGFRSEDKDSLASTLSVAVVSNDFISGGGSTQTLRSYLLLDSELKGAIENPASYFTDEDNLPSSRKLNLLMMVHGWRRYYWNELNTFRFEKLRGWTDAGLSVTGNVKSLFRKRPVIGGEIVLGPFSRNLLFEETRTDSSGRFAFDRLYLKDSSLVILNAKNERDRANTEIIPDPVFPFRPSVPDTLLSPWPVIPLMVQKDDYYRQLKQEDFIPERGNILLKEVKVIGQRMEKKDDNFRIYPEPDQVLKIKEEDYTYENLIDYLQGKIPGLTISGDQISMRGGGSPLYLLDGIEVSDFMVGDLVLHTHLSDIDKIEVLREGGILAAFGSKGGNGVISVYTKRGDTSAEIHRYIKGRITQRVRGFRKPLQFYSPRYSPANINSTKPDYRPTLYWEPALKMKGDHTSFSFFTSDDVADYSVIVEGISRRGKICSLRGDFKVSRKTSR